MNRGKFRTVEEAAAANPVNRKEVAQPRAAKAYGNIAPDVPKRAVGTIKAAEQFSGAQAGSRRHLSHETRLIAELRFRRTRAKFHALNGAGRQLRGKDFTLLIADRLAVDH